MTTSYSYPGSEKNSTSELLTSGAVFTGEIDLIAIAQQSQSLVVSVFSDVASAVDGLELRFSMDRINWDYVETYTVAAGAAISFERNIRHRYFQVRYTNGASDQTEFRLQTSFNSRLGSDSTGNNPLSVRLSDGGAFRATPEFLLDVAQGKIPGWSPVLLYGSKLNCDTVERDLWQGPTDIIWPSAAAPMSVVSSSDEDAVGETGVSAIVITGLDGNYDVITEILTLTGMTPAVTSASFLRINQAQAIASGGAEWNVGNITGTIAGGAVMYIVATDSATLQFSYTVPRNHELYVFTANVWQGRDNAGSTSLRIRPLGLPWFRFGSNEIYRTPVSTDIPFAPVGEKSDIRVTAKQISGGGSTALFATVASVLKDLATP